MKIPITKTELYGMQDHAWNMFCRHIKDQNVEYTAIQKAAALCFIYYSEIYDYRDRGGADNTVDGELETFQDKDWYHGHGEFFNYCVENDIKIDDLTQALVTIDAPEFAENLIKVSESGQNDDYYKADEWFVDNEEKLLNAIRKYWKGHLEEFYDIVDEDYTLCPPKDGFWVGVFIFAAVCIMMIIAAFTNPEGPPIEPLIISICALLSTGPVLLLYAKRWKISVNGDVITVRFVLLIKKCIRFDEISDVRTFNKGTIIYAHGKRLFFISKEIKMYKMFFTQLSLDGNVVDKPELFAIRRSNAKKVEGVMWPLCSIGVLIWVFQRQTVPASIYEIILFSAAVPLTFWYMIHCLRWKITGFENSIKVRTALRGEKEYRISDITKAEVLKAKLIVFTDDNKSFKISGGAGCLELIQKFQSENVPIYRNGELL